MSRINSTAFAVIAYVFGCADVHGGNPLQVVRAETPHNVATESTLSWISDGKLLLVARDRERAVIAFSGSPPTNTLQEAWRLKLPNGGPPAAVGEISEAVFAALDMAHGKVLAFRGEGLESEPRLVGVAAAPQRSAQLRAFAVNEEKELIYATAEASNQVCAWSYGDWSKPRLLQVIAADRSTFPRQIERGVEPRLKEVAGFQLPRTVILSSDKRDLYVNCFTSHSLLHFRVDASDGLLTHAHTYEQGSPVGDPRLVKLSLTFPMAIQMSPDGKNLYVGGTARNLAVFDRNAATGEIALSQLLTSESAGLAELLYVKSIRLSPDGGQVAVSSPQSGSVIILKRDGDGKLTHWKTFREADFKTPALGGVSDAIFTPNGKHIVATSSDAIAVVIPLTTDE